MSQVDPLDALLAGAMAEAYHKTIKASPAKGRATEQQKRIKPEKRFSNPERWKQTRTVALIHTESSTLLGNFREFIHDSLSARKLERVTEPCETDGVEWVSGPLWMREETEDRTKPVQWIETREAICGITLPEMGVHCPDAQVNVRLEFGGIARVELAEATRFTCPARNTFLTLPKHCDVLEVMSFDSKLALRSELGLDKPATEEE